MTLLILACNGATIDLRQQPKPDHDSAEEPPTDDSGELPGSDSGPSEPARLRLVLLGDAGEQQVVLDGVVVQESEQDEVAGAVDAVCAREGCDAVVYLGDNFYPDGVETADDERWDTQFSDMYSVDAPFWVVLGNHDYGEVLMPKGPPQEALDAARAQVQLGYTGDTRWTLPAPAWSVSHAADVELFFFDSSPEVYAVDANAEPGEHTGNRLLAEELAASSAGFKIAVAHHPYVSNGRHGNAGSYDEHEGACTPESWVDPTEPRAGACYEAFVLEHVCGEVDLFVSGHDHSLQVLDGPAGCFGTAIISGSGSKIHDPDEHPLTDNNPARFQEAVTGFVWLELCQGAIESLVVYDADGAELYRESGSCG